VSAAPVPAPASAARPRRRRSGGSVAISRNGRIALTAFFVLFLLFLYLPTLVLIVFSFNKGTIQAFPLQGFTTDWYSLAYHNQGIRDALKNSLVVASVVAVLTTLLAVMVSYPLARRRFRGKAALSALILLPLVVPTVVLGIALLILLQKGPQVSGVSGLGLHAVGIGHIVIALPFCVLILMPRIASIDHRLEEAAHDLGASGLVTFRKVILPLITPALISSLLIAFVVSIDEVVIASFLVKNDVTYPIFLYSSLKFPEQTAQLIPVATVMITISFLIALLSEVIRRFGERRVGITSVV